MAIMVKVFDILSFSILLLFIFAWLLFNNLHFYTENCINISSKNRDKFAKLFVIKHMSCLLIQYVLVNAFNT